MANCPDCGTKLSGGICSNCQEEAYILENQADYITEPVSEDFAEKARAQQSQITRNRRRMKREREGKAEREEEGQATER